MSDGNKFDLTSYTQQRQQVQLPFEEMGNVLLDAMQGTLMCLDSHHIIIDVSKTIKQYFGFEQAEIVGISILLLIEDSERELFFKFLSSTSQLFDICYVRMMMAISNEYRQVKVHRKRKFSQDNADVHSTTANSNGSLGSILVLTLDDASYIDLNLFDIYKQEFYTKMNLLGEIIFEDHRGTLITGYLPHELASQSIFNFVYHEDRLVKLHALWKCVTTGASKLQWRFNARDGVLVFLQTEYKLVANHQNQDTIVARNEVLSSVQRSQFEELQTAWRHQCAADIKGNSSSFKLITSIDTDPSSIPSGECCISVPSLNMCFSTKKLQSLHIQGNIFDGTKLTRPLTIQDYISILIEHDKYLDNELIHIINNISSLATRMKRSVNENESSDVQMKETSQDDDLLSRKKTDSDSIVRGILNNSMKYTQEKPTGDVNSTLNRLLNENPLAQQANQSKTNQVILNPEAIQQQHIDFIKKYRSAKAKLESQLESARTQELANGGQANDILKCNTILNKLSQLENIKNKHLARTFELQRQTQQVVTASRAETVLPHTQQQPLQPPPLPRPPPPSSASNLEQKDLMNNFFPSPSSKSMPMEANPSTLYNTPSNNFCSQQRHPSTMYRTFDANLPSYHDSQSRMKTPIFDEYPTPPPSYMPMSNSSLSVHSYMNVSFQDANTNSSSSFNHHNTTYPF